MDDELWGANLPAGPAARVVAMDPNPIIEALQKLDTTIQTGIGQLQNGVGKTGTCLRRRNRSSSPSTSTGAEVRLTINEETRVDENNDEHYRPTVEEKEDLEVKREDKVSFIF